MQGLNGGYMPELQVPLTATEFEGLKRLAEVQGKTPEELMRELYLAQLGDRLKIKPHLNVR